MTRALTSGMVTEVTATALRPILFFEFIFDSAPVRFWTGIGDITFGGNVYAGAGNIIGLSDYEETENLEARGVTFTVSGIPSSLLSIAIAEPYQGRVCKCYFGALDVSTGALISDPYQLFSGFMDVMEIIESGETATISIAAENKMIILTRAKEGRYTPEDQKRRFDGDLGLDFVPQLQDKEIVWKAKN